MSELDIAAEKNLDEDDDVGSKKEQDVMDGAESSAKHARYRIPGPSLGDAMAVLKRGHKTAHSTKYRTWKQVKCRLYPKFDCRLCFM